MKLSIVIVNYNSSDDLAQWLKGVPALGRVVVLDTCEAGGLAAALTAVMGLLGGLPMLWWARRYLRARGASLRTAFGFDAWPANPKPVISVAA